MRPWVALLLHKLAFKFQSEKKAFLKKPTCYAISDCLKIQVLFFIIVAPQKTKDDIIIGQMFCRRREGLDSYWPRPGGSTKAEL